MPPKPAKDQPKSTPTSKSANDKDTIKRQKILVDSLQKEKETWEKKLKEKDEEIERLKVVQGFCGEGDNVSTTPITNSRDLRSAPAANGTTGEGNIQDQSKEIKRLTRKNEELNEKLNNLTEENKKLKEECDKITDENKKLKEECNKMSEDSQLLGTEFCRACKDIERMEGTRKEKDIKNRKERSKEENKNLQKPELNDENKQPKLRISELEKTESELKDKIEKLEETLSKTQKENTDRLYEEETKNSDLKKQIEELQKTQSQEKERIEKPSAEDKKNSDLTQKIKDLEIKLSQLEQESKDKLSRVMRVEQEKLDLKRECEELQKKLSQKENDNKSKLEEKDKENSKLSKTIDDLQTEIAQLKKANKSNSPKPAASRDLKDAEAQVKQLKENNEKLMEEKIKAVKEVNNLKNRLAEKDKEKSQLTKTINDLQTEKEQLKKTNKSNSPKSAASRDLKDAEVKQLQERNEKLMEEKNKAVKEVDNLKNRLSQIAGSKLTDNNPGIADLSDPNRPLNLGEKFSELYDNQWTDAMEEMTRTVDEKQAIEILLRIVNDAYEFCVEKSDGYCEQIEAGITKLFNTKLSSLQKKLTKDYRKSMAVYLVSDLEEEFCKRSYKLDGESVKSYQKHCIRVCWFMAVQDPKVFIDVEDVSGKKFEDDKYKHYTKTGKVTDYLVWPVLYLHKGGPMLGKGVAQGK